MEPIQYNTLCSILHGACLRFSTITSSLALGATLLLPPQRSAPRMAGPALGGLPWPAPRPLGRLRPLSPRGDTYRDLLDWRPDARARQLMLSGSLQCLECRASSVARGKRMAGAAPLLTKFSPSYARGSARGHRRSHSACEQCNHSSQDFRKGVSEISMNINKNRF